MSNQRFSKKILNICIVAVIIVIIIFVAMMFVLNYNVNGESNMPFDLSKISIISTVNGQDVENSTEKWNIDVVQNNDIYLYIEKNENYNKQETITTVEINNLNVKQTPNIGVINFYKPCVNDTTLFKNTDENRVDSITFKGSTSTDTRNLEISNQGGVISFRCANDNIGNYTSNDDEEINYNKLLSKLKMQYQDIMSIVSFDVLIKLDSGKTFKAENVELQIPNDGIVEKGTIGKEYTDLNEIVFKRIEN